MTVGTESRILPKLIEALPPVAGSSESPDISCAVSFHQPALAIREDHRTGLLRRRPAQGQVGMAAVLVSPSAPGSLAPSLESPICSRMAFPSMVLLSTLGPVRAMLGR